jgi:hypothetical protein
MVDTSKDVPDLRPKQVEQVKFYASHKKCLDLSDPGTGKTPPCCVYAYMNHAVWGKRTLWSMPKSLLKKNKKELLRFTPFEDDDVVIMTTDRADLTSGWTGATIASHRVRRGFRCRLPGSEVETDTITLRDAAGVPTKYCYRRLAYLPDDQAGPPAAEWVILGHGLKVVPGYGAPPGVLINPIMGPDRKPEKISREDPEVFKDLIAAAALKGAKVFICTFAFMSMHWERMLKAAPDIDLLLVDELHMGYGGPTSAQTDSFYQVNRHVSRFVGMTGTIINGRLDSAFPAIHAIEPKYYGSHDGFLFEHGGVFDDYGRVVSWIKPEKVAEILKRHSIRHTFEETYGEEDVVFITEDIEIDPVIAAKYNEFHEKAMLELEDGRVLDGTMPGVNLIRARQILSHPETMALGVTLPKLTSKDERLLTHIAPGRKMLVFASLKPEQRRLKALLESQGLRVALINSDVSGSQRSTIDDAAQRGELDAIVASGPTTAVGYNWEMFDIVLFASIDYMDVNILQAYRRASRGTRTKTLYVVFLRYENSCEERMYQIVTAKSQLANSVDETRRVLFFSI